MKMLLLLSLASTAAAFPAVSTLNEQRKSSTKIQVHLGDAPPSKYIDRSFPSYSFELAYWSEFVGGLNEPNEFTLKVLQKYVLHYCVASCLPLLTFGGWARSIIDRTGQAPLIRIGGASQYVAPLSPDVNPRTDTEDSSLPKGQLGLRQDRPEPHSNQRSRKSFPPSF